MKSIGVLVVNLGTPASPSRNDVKRYLTEFLMDERVIDIPTWKRYLLVKGIIAPFRSTKVAKEYKKLWEEDGSPLLIHGRELVRKIQFLFSNNKQKVHVELAMRYQNPSIESGLDKLLKQNVDRIIVFPLFPQYASATTGSVAQKVMEIMATKNVIPNIDFIQSYHEESWYIEAFANKVARDIEKYQPDHVLFSYHGVPERHLKNIQAENDNNCKWPKCGCEIKSSNKPYCYRSACTKTSELIAKECGLSYTKFTSSFQSRLGKDPWIQPYTDETIKHLLKIGVKNLLVVSPSFTADCLETTLEIGEEYRDLFMEHGGESFHFTKSLNSDDFWAEKIHTFIKSRIDENENNFNHNYDTTYLHVASAIASNN